MADLRQLLSQGRKRIGILIGAGAPMSLRIDTEGHLAQDGAPLLPGVDDLTKRVLSNLEGKFAEAAHAIQDELGKASNIETILSRIRLLQNALGSAEVKGLNSTGYEQLGKQICEQISGIVGASLPAERCAYNDLVAWIAGIQRPHPVEIFTTNYDLLIEEAFEAAHAPYFDGFSGSSAPFFDAASVANDDLPSRWSRLWKLHGSLGWKARAGRIVRTAERGASELVYPDHLKYDLTQKQPYSALFDRLKQFLKTPDTLLLTTGFSFRDAHICAVLNDTLPANANSAVIAFQYGSVLQEFPARKLAFENPNFSLYAADGAIIGGVEGPWRPGDPPKNWLEIRRSFWGARGENPEPTFLLGDFSAFCRFCALSQSTDLMAQAQPDAEPQQEAEKGSAS